MGKGNDKVKPETGDLIRHSPQFTINRLGRTRLS